MYILLVARTMRSRIPHCELIWEMSLNMLKIGHNNKSSFSVHNEMMKQFSRAHGKVVTCSSARVKEPDITSRTKPLVIKCDYLDGGGSYRAEQTISRFIFPPLPKIADYKVSPS